MARVGKGVGGDPAQKTEGDRDRTAERLRRRGGPPGRRRDAAATVAWTRVVGRRARAAAPRARGRPTGGRARGLGRAVSAPPASAGSAERTGRPSVRESRRVDAST